MPFELLLAFHYLRLRGSAGVIALFSLLGIMIGVATLTVTTAVMNGFRVQLIDSVTSVNGHINLHGMLDEAIVKDIREYQYVESAIPTINSQAMISSHNYNSGVFIRGIKEEDIGYIKDNLVNGTLENFPDGILIGSILAKDLRVGIGDKVTILSPQSISTMVGNFPKIKTATVIGIFEFGMSQYDNMLTYMPIATARKFFRYNESIVNNIDIKVKNPESADLIAQELGEKFEVYASSWKGGYVEALETERTVMFLILTMIVLVASFNIISSLIILVQNKKNAIAILRTIGATRGSIMRIFIICGFSIGLVGTSLGLVLGLVFINNIETIKIMLEYLSGASIFNPLIYFFSKVPSVIVMVDLVKITFMSLLLSLFAAILPSIKAAKQDPAELLRGQ